MKALDIALENLRVGDPVSLDNLTMYPLLGVGVSEPNYLTVDEAIGLGLARVTEVSEQGSVPELRFENDAAQPVLLLDGEELVGAKQNRIVNLTIMVAPKSVTVIPVSCVEAGRWTWRSEAFESADRAFFSRGRADKTAQINASMCADGTRYSDQSAVWDAIARKSARMRTRSTTGAAAAMYDDNAKSLDAFVESMRPVTDQICAAFAINGELVGLDLFDSQATLSRQLTKLVRSYALDAIDEQGSVAHSGEPGQCEALIDTTKKAGRNYYRAVGMGEDVRLDSADVKGGALVVDERLVHLCAFRVTRGRGERDAPGQRGQLARASHRRHLYRQYGSLD